jgi:hypothetical protein
MASITWRTLTVEADGTLTSSPSTMHAETGDGIAWFVNNESAVTVKVRIKDFKRKSSGGAIDPVDFLVQRCTVDPGDPPGMIVGQVSFLPAGSPVLTKYTIEVKSSLLNKDYDPDLEIERPPAF